MKIDDDIFKTIMKESKYASLGSEGLLSDTKHWIDTGSYMFNALLSGSFFKGFPGNKIVAFAGSKSSGKTQIAMYILKNFLNENVLNKVIYFDSEGAITSDMLFEFEFDLKRFMHVIVKSANDFKSIIYNALDAIEKTNNGNNYFFILDSLGSLELEEEREKILKNKDTADMGRRAQYLRTIFRRLTSWLSVLNIPMLVTSHVYDTMSLYSQKEISGGKGLQYAANTIVEFIPARIKRDKEIIGTNITARARKSRATIEYKTTELALLYKGGLSKYYGLIDFALQFDYFKKDGNKIKLMNGDVLSKKEISENPTKYFNDDVLKELDVYAKEYFSYSKIEENVTE